MTLRRKTQTEGNLCKRLVCCNEQSPGFFDFHIQNIAVDGNSVLLTEKLAQICAVCSNVFSNISGCYGVAKVLQNVIANIDSQLGYILAAAHFFDSFGEIHNHLSIKSCQCHIVVQKLRFLYVHVT